MRMDRWRIVRLRDLYGGALALFLVCSVFLYSCAPRRSEVALNTRIVTAPVLMEMVRQREQLVRSLTGSGSVSFESPEMAGTAAFELSLKKPDSLLVTLEGPFGIDVGTFFLSRERYVMYNSFENLAITGTPSHDAIRTLVPIDLTFDQIISAFSGIAPLPPASELRSYEINDDRFLLTFACGENICRYWVDPAYLLVARYQMLDSSYTELFEARFVSFRDEDGVTVPRRISVSVPPQGRRISVSYSSLTTNGITPSFAFSIPPNARTIVR
jgi:outer membrane lipoprotein-sorting protein